MHNSVAKKIFAVGVAASTAVMGLAPFVASAAVHAAGTNVKSSDGTIWMIMPDNTRRAYTSAGAFLSYGFNSFSAVVDASAEDLALPAGSFIPPQDGKVICSDRGADKGTCYLISSGMKAGFTSAAVFTGLGFSFSRATYGDVSWMSSTSNIDNTTSAHLPGVLINNGGTVQLRGTASNLGIPDIATFNTWGYSFADVVPANATDKAIVQAGVMAARVAGQLSPSFTTNPNQPPVQTGSVTASLASDTPAAQTVAVNGIAAASSTVVTMAKFNFSGTGTVTQVQVKRTGVSPDSIVNNAYLYNGDTRLSDAASIGGNSTISFNNPNGLFTVNGNTTVSVVVEIAGNAGAGQTIAMQLVSLTVANGTPMAVSVTGNLFTTSTASDLASATFGAITPTGSSFDPSNDVVVFRSNVTVSQRDMTMSRLIVRNIGSAQQNDIRNFRLRVDGTQVASTQTMDSNGYVYFTFSPVTLKSGTREIVVLADIISGSSRNFQFQIRNKADVNFTDTQYNTSIAAANSFPVGSASSNTINSGTMTITKSTDSPSGNVTVGSSDVSLGKFVLTAYGESMKVETLTVAATSSDLSVGALRNGRLLINGVQYGSTATLASTTNNSYTAGGTEYTLNYTVNPGSPVTVEVRADMYDNSGSNDLTNDDRVTAYVVAVTNDNNVQRMTSLGYVSAPSSSIGANTITVVSGSATLNRNNNYASQTTTLPQTNYKLAAFNLVGSTSEDINLTSIDLNLGSSSTTLANLNDVSVKINGNVFGTIKATVSTTTSTSTYSGTYTLAKNANVAVEVYATLPSATLPSGSDTFQAKLYVNGTTSGSAATVGTGAAGQTISVGTGSITAAKDASSPSSALVDDSQTKTFGAFKFTTTNDTITISQVVISMASSTTVQNVILKDGSTVLGTIPGAASTTFSNLSIVVPPNTTKVLTVDVQLGSVGASNGTSGEQVQVVLDSYKWQTSSGTLTTTTSGVTANTQYVYKAIPTVTTVAPSSTVLQGGGATNVPIYKFSVSSGGTGTVAWKQVNFTIATSSATTTAYALWDESQQINGTFAGDGATTISFTPTNAEEISGSKTYTLKATVTGGTSSGNSVSVNIPQGTTTFSMPVASTTVAGTSTFTWSDLSAQSHSETTLDWNDDFLIKNLPTDSWALVK